MPVGIYTRTEEAKRNMSLARLLRKEKLGYINSSETRLKISLTSKGRPSNRKGQKHTEEARRKMSVSLKGRVSPNKGKKYSSEFIAKMSLNRMGKPTWNKGLKCPQMSGEKNGMWIADRTKLKKKQERNDSAYHEWRKNVWVRDNHQCRIKDSNCKGRIVAHHILGWSKYPELRYDVNNGITLCRYHHPKRRIDETMLEPVFKNLVIAVV